jgi:sialate O-acetylesterase
MLAAFAVALMPGGQAGPAAPPFIDPLFSDNMVLQRDTPDNVWGWTTPGASVTVAVGQETRTTTAGSDGKWLTKMPPKPAGGPYPMIVNSGSTTVKFQNVMYGDVWVCSGQSNMEFGVGNLLNPDAVTSAANYPNLRLYFVPHAITAAPLPYITASWEVCTPDNLKSDGDWNGFSAVAYFFGQKLQEDLKVPIGLIHTSWGGTVAESWTRKADLQAKLPQFDSDIAAVEASAKPVKMDWDQWYTAFDDGAKNNWGSDTFDDSSWPTMQVPNHVQDSGLPGFDARQSVFWLRRTVDLTADQAQQDATLRLMVDDNDATFVNGKQVGATDGYNTQRAYKLPAGLLRTGTNVIAVRVTDTQAPGGIWGDPNTLGLVLGSNTVSLAGPWKVKLGAAVGSNNAMPVDVMGDPNHATLLYNGMIAPLAPFTFKGAIWYQGESNAGRGYEYRTLLPTMITSWRETFGEGDFPFLIVQLAGFQHPPAQPGDDAWAEVREAEWLTTKSIKHVGLATAVDVGEMDDIHPKNKQEVGRRLALVAEHEDYGMKVIDSGPLYKSFRIQNGAISVSFDHTDGGIDAKGGAPLHGFAIAGSDHKWYWADAKIDGKNVIVSSPQVPQPVAVRYYWATFSDANLENGAGLPALPFRTDDWKLSSQK